MLAQSQEMQFGVHETETIHHKLLLAPPSDKPSVSFIRQAPQTPRRRAAFPSARHRPSSAGARLPMTSRTSQDCINFPNKNQSAEERDEEEGLVVTGQDTPSDWECTAGFIGNSLTGKVAGDRGIVQLL